MSAEPSPLSAASLRRQIAREGKRWGLVPETGEDGHTRVVEVTHEAEARFGIGEVVRRPNRRICTVNDEAPFSEALRNRVDNGETDLSRRYKLLEELEGRAHLKRQAEAEAETLSIWKSRKRITSLGGGRIIPAGLANRRAPR
jgi:hypothetical protein